MSARTAPPAISRPPPSTSAVLSDFSAMQALIDDLPEQIALLDGDCTIVAANDAWKQAVLEYGYLDAMPGGNYRDVCAKKAAEGYEPAVEALAALDDIRTGVRSFWQLVYNGRERWSGRDYQITMHRIGHDAGALISVTRFDLTEILELRRANASLEGTLAQQEGVQRRRLARELHDSTGQLLTAMSLLLCRLRDEAGERCAPIVEELQTLVRDASREIRLTSYLASPPAVEKLGLVEGLKSLVEGFGRRTSLQIAFDIRGKPRTLASEEQALYRVAQEALSNVHRHAHASRARVVLDFRKRATHLAIADDGTGMTPAALRGTGAGVGLGSMRARLSDLGGRLTVGWAPGGTTIIASVPAAA